PPRCRIRSRGRRPTPHPSLDTPRSSLHLGGTERISLTILLFRSSSTENFLRKRAVLSKPVSGLFEGDRRGSGEEAADAHATHVEFLELVRAHRVFTVMEGVSHSSDFA